MKHPWQINFDTQGNDYIMKFEIRNLEKTYFNSLISNIQTCPYDQMEVRMDGFLISEHEFF